jgi:hypothetical protein
LLFLKILQVEKSRAICFFFSFILINACLYNAWIVPAHADYEHGATASVALRGTYTDNVQFTGGDDYVLNISPSLALSAVTEVTQMQVAADLDIRKYKNNDDLSSLDQYYQVLGGVALEERVEIDIVGTHLRDHTFQSELEETGIVIDQTSRNRTTISPIGTFWLAPRTRMQLTYEYGDTNFSSEDRRDYTYHLLRLGWLHDLQNERTTLGFLVGANRTEYGDNIDNPNQDVTYDGVGAGMMLDHMFSETFIMNLKAGASYTESKTNGPGGDDTASDTNFVGEASFRWIFERSALSALVNQQVVPSSAGENVARTKANLGLRYRFTEKFGSNLNGHYRRSDPLRGGQTVETFGGGVGLTYRFTEHLGLSLNYSYTKTDQESDSVVDDQTNRVFLQLTWLIHRPEWRVKPPKPLVRWPHRL